MRSRYKLVRKGTVENPSSHPYKCGSSGRNILWYEMELYFTNPQYDNKGFLVEHERIDAQIVPILGQKLSCEIMAEDAIESLWEFFRNNTEIDNMSITFRIGKKDGQAYFEITKT